MSNMVYSTELEYRCIDFFHSLKHFGPEKWPFTVKKKENKLAFEKKPVFMILIENTGFFFYTNRYDAPI